MTPLELHQVLAELAETGRGWIAVVPPAALRQATRTAPAAAVVDLTDTRAVPITVNPFSPVPRRPAQLHIDRLAGLLAAAYRPPGPVRAVLRLALRQAYARGGWDLAIGVLPAAAVMPGAVPPWVPGIADLTRAALAAADDLGCDTAVRAAVRAFCAGTLLPLWQGPAGRFLAGGHPPDLAALLASGVVFTAGEVAGGDEAFLAGTMLYRLADELAAAGAKPAVVVADPTAGLHRVLTDIAAQGLAVQHASVPIAAPAASAPAVVSASAPLLGRRSVACGLQCRQRPCAGGELHRATRLAGHDAQVWLRLWSEALLLAFLTGNPLPQVPYPLRRSLLPLDVRTRECVLATLIDAGVARRARALRHSYDPLRLTGVAASAAAGLLALRPNSPGAAAQRPFRAGQVWVVPQLRWLHEAERLTPLHRDQPAAQDIAPPLDFELAGLVDWPGIRVADRMEGLRCHQLSMDRPHNRALALLALAGDDGDGAHSALAEDIAIAGIGHDHRQRLGYVARMLGTGPRGDGPGWLEVVLSWPGRLIQPSAGAEAAPTERAATG